MDQLRAIRTFLEVVDQGGFAGAARALDLSPAVVTRLVAELERHLGTRLLNRTTRRVALTPAGTAYAEQTRRLLAGIAEADAAAQATSRSTAGHIKVQVPPAFAVHQLARVLPAFHLRCPQVTIELLASGPVQALGEHSDLALIVTQGPDLDGDFIARPLARSELVLCASAGYLRQRGRPGHPDELALHELLVPPIASVRRGVHFHRGPLDDEPAAVVTVRPRQPVVSSMQLDAVFAAAAAGMGIVGLPSFMADEALREGRFERVLEQWHVATLSIHVGLPSRHHLPASTRAFRDFLVETFGSLPDADPWLAAAGAPAPGLALGSPGQGGALPRLPS
jgi:DNA-binding transcriptional LysR family regulator